MNKQAIKIDLIHWLTELEDEETLEELYKIKSEESVSKENYLTSKQKQELDRRIEKYETGEMEFSTWGDVKQRIRNKSKDAL